MQRKIPILPRDAKREEKVEVKSQKAIIPLKKLTIKKRVGPGKSARVHARHFEGLGDVTPSLAASLIDPNMVYKVKMTYNPGVYSTDGAGVLKGSLSIDPAVVSYSEFSTWSALFSELRVAKVSLIVANVNPHYDAFAAGDVKTSVPIAWDDNLDNFTPASTAAVTDNARVFYHGLGDPSMAAHTVSTRDRSFANIASTGPGPYAGCLGCFYWYQTGLTVSAPYIQLYLAVEFEWRNRV